MKKAFRLTAAGVAVCFVLSLFSCASVPSDSSEEEEDTTPREYEEEEFPQWLRDLRRFEIVTLGSVPFLSIFVRLGYSGILYATGQSSSFNPFGGGDQGYNQDDYLRMFGISIGAGAAVGLADFIVNIVRRSIESRRIRELEEQNQIIVVPRPDAESQGSEPESVSEGAPEDATVEPESSPETTQPE